MTTLALARDLAPPSHPLTAAFVLHACRLRPGTALASTARFDDNVWPLGPTLHQDHMRNMILDFTTLPARWRVLSKEASTRIRHGTSEAALLEPPPTTRDVDVLRHQPAVAPSLAVRIVIFRVVLRARRVQGRRRFACVRFPLALNDVSCRFLRIEESTFVACPPARASNGPSS